jgi:hypothetical protein
MIAGPEDPNSRRVSAAKTSRSDTLSYISDIVQELKRLAEKAEYRTLAAILGVALFEARTQSKESER